MTDRERILQVVDYMWTKALESVETGTYVDRAEYVKMASDRILALTATAPQPSGTDRERIARIICADWDREGDIFDGMTDGDKYFYLETADRILALTATPTWRPIETAPKDGTQVLLSGVGLKRWVSTGHYLKGHWWDDDGPGWLAKVDYWMPLPEPPAGDGP